MNNTEKTLSPEQHFLVSELAATYGIEREQVHFFNDDERPFFEHEAAAVLVRSLAGAVGIENEPVASVFPDSLAMKCKLQFEDGSTSSHVGIANLRETINGQPMSDEQIQRLATSRAMRGALVNAGIDLLKLHQRAKTGVIEFATQPVSQHAVLLRQAHVLGQEAGLIVGLDKGAWQQIMQNRYDRIHSNELTVEELADFVAVLKTLVPQRQTAA